MFKAIDNEGKEILIWHAESGVQYFCPICHKPMIQRRGEHRSHHFAHVGDKTGVSVCTDKWHYDKTPWHTEWQKRFPEECCEKIICSDGIKHIADVQLNDIVIEFQHSTIAIDDFRQRNDFYKKAGFNVIWVFDVSKEWSEGKIREVYRSNNKYTWSYPRKPFRDMVNKSDIKDDRAAVFFQFSNDDGLNIERVTGGYNSFSQFYTDKQHSLTPYDFVSKATNSASSLFPGTKDYSKTPDSVPNGHSIIELWDETYSYMVVDNLFNGKTMFIKGYNGKMERQEGKEKGQIVGRYSWQTNGRYQYSREKYVVWDAEKSIWALKKNKKLSTNSFSRLSSLKNDVNKTLFELVDTSKDSPCVFYCALTKEHYCLQFVDQSRRHWNAFLFNPATGEVSDENKNKEVHSMARLPCWRLLNSTTSN